MFATTNSMLHRPGTVPGLGLTRSQEQDHQEGHLPSITSTPTSTSRQKRKISSRGIPSSSSTLNETRTQHHHQPQQHSYPSDANHQRNHNTQDIVSNPSNQMLNHSRQRVPSSMSTLSACGPHTSSITQSQNQLPAIQNQSSSSRYERGAETSPSNGNSNNNNNRRTSPLPPLPTSITHRTDSRESYLDQSHYRHNHDLGIRPQSGSRRDRPERRDSRQYQQEQAIQQQQQQLPPMGDPLTIRDILNSKELRNQISEMRRSINSNSDDPQRGFSPMKEFDPRISQEAIYQRDRLYGKTISSNSNNGESDQARVGHHYREHAQHATGGSSNYDARRPVQEDSVVTDLSMDNSLLEQRFRVKLDVAIPTNGPTRQGAEARTQHRNQYTHPGVANGPFQNISDNRDTYNTQNQHAEQLPSSPERRARDLYHSSYSPSEFSQTEDVVDVENSDQGAGNDEDDDQSNTTEIKASGTPTPTGPPALTTTHRPPPSSTVLNPTPTTNNTGHVINVTSTQMNPRPTGNRPHNDPKYDDGEISFQREVARARAKRELSQSVQHQIAAPGGQPFYNHDNGREITGAQSLKTTSNVRKLDHGRDLAIEDLASPTHYGFDNRESSADEGGRAQRQNRGDGPAGTSRFSLLGAATDLAKMDIITEKEDMFMELAEDLGEGQAVASVLGTLKGMIRQLKIEKRTSQRAIKKLQKDLKQSQRELERTRKAKEKLAAAKAKRTATHPSSALDSVDIMKNPPRSSNTPRRTVEEQKTAILVEQQENEARGAAAVIGKQKDLIERNLATLQNRIDALERQKDAVRKRDLRRAEEEADLLLLIKTDSEDEDEDDESSSSSEDESDLDDEDQEQGEEEVEEEEEREDLRSTVRYIGPSNKEAKGHHGTAEHDMRHSQRRPQKDILSNGASSQRSTRVPLDVTESSKAQKKGSVSKSLRTKSDHPEEVHVHHHVHYEDEEILELLGVHSKSRGAASGGHSPRVPFARSLASTTSRLGKLSEESEDQTAEVHRVNLGTGFRSSRRGSQTEGSDDIHRVRPSSSTTAVHEVYPQRQVQLAGQTLLSRVRGEEAELTSATARLRFKDDDEEGSGKKSSVVVSGPQKKISINKARIMALLKNHNPKRCTVCCDGGTDGQHCTRHRYHEHKTITTTSAASSTNGTSGSQDLDRHRHRQEGLTVGATSSVRFEKSLSSPSRSPLHVQALLSMDNSEKDDSESDDNATAHGSQRRGDVNFKGRVEIDGGASSSVTTAAMSQTKTNGKSQPRSSSGETKNKTGKQPASTTRTVDEQKQQPQSVVGVLQLQTELSQLQDEILSLRKSFVKRTAPVSASTSASATTAPISNETPTQTSSASATASTSKAAVPSAI